MSLPATVWRIASGLARTVFSQAWQIVSPSYSIEILAKDDLRLVLQHDGCQIVADKRDRTVRSGARVRASFDSIRSIDIRHCSGDEEGPEFWEISLRLGGSSRVLIGRSSDGTEASIVAARLATVTGKKVLAL
jgi:hypothetical protein